MTRKFVILFAILLFGVIPSSRSRSLTLASEQPEDWNGVPFGVSRTIVEPIIGSLFSIQFWEENSIVAVAVQDAETLLVKFTFDPIQHELSEISYGGNEWYGDSRLAEYASKSFEIPFASVERNLLNRFGDPTFTRNSVTLGPIREWRWNAQADCSLWLTLTSTSKGARAKYTWRSLTDAPREYPKRTNMMSATKQGEQVTSDQTANPSNEMLYARSGARSEAYAIGGLCLLAAGIVSFVSASAWNSASNDLDDLVKHNPDLSSILATQRDRYKRNSGDLTVAGAFCCVTGIVLEILAINESREAGKFLRLSASSGLDHSSMQLAINL